MMGRKSNKEIFVFIILIPLFMFAILTISKYTDGSGNDLTITGKGSQGYSIIYEALGKMGFNTVNENKELKAGSEASLQVVTESMNISREDEGLKEWVMSGGSLLLLTTLDSYDLSYGTDKEVIGPQLYVYRYGKGTVILASAYKLTNKAMAQDRGSAYEIVKTLQKTGYSRIVFNEFYIYGESEIRSLWADIPYELKFVLYQFLIVLILIIYYKGKRFGRIVPYYEEVERTENEYVYSAAALYKKAKCYDVVLENYFNALISEMKRELRLYNDINLNNWTQIWEKEGLPCLDKVKEIAGLTMDDNLKAQHKECLKAISYFEDLTGILRKRREEFWKQVHTRG
jgi:hypothetical protein